MRALRHRLKYGARAGDGGVCRALRLEFHAREVGDANRSTRVERPFDYIENAFFPGRTFTDWDDLNAQARAWCDRVNAKYRRHLHASPRELFAAESAQLVPLPGYLPDVYALCRRRAGTSRRITGSPSPTTTSPSSRRSFR